ncbi:sodium:proton antiporter [Actinobacillus succinogenes]|uniref:Sodium/hydrogen exchanger n=1 Tax=Actinobacillus succinogenes (strain ATCC 55618 / DSM 22257 / CCUG 43843 / 130Z) TaxID=339671 RepID=A6VLW7_ACTSZ|nr:sodium:proton antiporter [Actinobacillus succinogenes]ABR73964.1 sodium/hydrogen exchanger [Actinobacillus succinogenes 130Z]PHI39593.1 sodium:proton antiporter [Actinobacillus succinogenes]
MEIYSYICFLFGLAMFINFFTLKINENLQSTIIITASAMVGSLLLWVLSAFGWFKLDQLAISIMEKLDFQHFLLDGMLGFLLFAGSLGIKLPLMKEQRREIAVYALFSTFASTFIIGFLIYAIANLLGLNIDFIYCLLFGALISPTDPIAVLAIIKNLKAPKRMSMQVEGESLFNDGIGLVIFTTIFAVAFEGRSPTFGGVLGLFLQEAVGGILFGLLTGFVAHSFISATDDGSLEILITLTIPTVGYSMANLLHVSGALTMVVSGIMIGNWTRRQGFSRQSRLYLDNFWEMIDHSLNSLLFLLIGLVLLLVDFSFESSLLMLFAIPVCLTARYISLWIPYRILSRFRAYNPYTLRILTWGGLRGGLALAMALSIPTGAGFITGGEVKLDVRDVIILMTYTVVTFSILVQGTTIENMIKKSKCADPVHEAYVKLGASKDFTDI